MNTLALHITQHHPLPVRETPSTLFYGYATCEPGHLFKRIALVEPGEKAPQGMVPLCGLHLTPSRTSPHQKSLATVWVEPAPTVRQAWATCASGRYATAFTADTAPIQRISVARRVDDVWLVALHPPYDVADVGRSWTIGVINGATFTDLLQQLNVPIADYQRVAQFPDWKATTAEQCALRGVSN